MSERHDAIARLENWSRWCTSSGRAGADCMTGAICDGLRRAALGNVWSGHGDLDRVDEADALLIERAMRAIEVAHLLMLHWHYIIRSRPEVTCRKMSIPARPAHVFTEALDAAHGAIMEAARTGRAQ